jgi:hypothetical protein
MLNGLRNRFLYKLNTNNNRDDMKRIEYTLNRMT